MKKDGISEREKGKKVDEQEKKNRDKRRRKEGVKD